VREKLDDYTYDEVTEQLAMLDGAGHPFDLAAVRAGQQTPVYFGSAVNNFGIQLLLDGFLQDSVPPAPAVRGHRALAPQTQRPPPARR
jgi:peptide chain release factor 3